MPGLTDKQREFARLLVTGVAQAEAYRKAFGANKKSEAAIRSCASRLAKNANVVQFCDILRHDCDVSAIASRQERMEWLTARMRECAAGGDIRGGVACIAELNKMDGAYEPEKLEVSGSLGVGAVVAALQQQTPGLAKP